MLNNELLSILNDIRSNKDNQNRCFECSMICPSYISSNLGIFLCFICAGVHQRNLPENVSKTVEIIPMNVPEIQNYIDFFFCGGNKRFSEFLEFYDLKSTVGSDFSDDKIIIDKYKTFAVSYYRNLLENEVKGIVCNSEMPSFEEGREIDESIKFIIKKEGKIFLKVSQEVENDRI
jgi:hypothetical protein